MTNATRNDISHALQANSADCSGTPRPSILPVLHRTTLVILAACISSMAFIVIVGCDRTADSLKEQTSAPNDRAARLVSAASAPRAAIDACIQAYKQLSSYQDQSYVRLRYRLDGQALEDRAPFAVAWDGQSQIGLRIYSVMAGPGQRAAGIPNSSTPIPDDRKLQTSGSENAPASQLTVDRWWLRLSDDADATEQVLSRDWPRRMDMNWLLQDPLVAQQLSAGLAGFPPQLELLFGPKPLAGLIDESSALAFAAPDTVDGRAQHVIRVQRGTAEYVLWIDQATLLLRRMLLPHTRLLPEMLADKRISETQLTIEFAQVRTNEPVDWSDFTVKEKPSDRRVSRFVAPPMLLDTTGLGERIPGFVLFNNSGGEVYNSARQKSERKATVLLWLADHPTCRSAALQLQNVAEQLRQSGAPSESVEFVPIWAEPEPPTGSTFDSLIKDWQLPGRLAVDREAMGRDLFDVQEAPTLVVVDQNNVLQLREVRHNPLLDQLLPDVLKRLVQGQDLASEMIDSQAKLAAHFEAELSMAAAIDSSELRAKDISKNPLMQTSSQHSSANRPYAPLLYEVVEISRQTNPSPALAAAVDASSVTWVLFEDGYAEQFSSSGKRQGRIKTNFDLPRSQASNSEPSVRIDVSAEFRYLACAANHGATLEVLDCKTLERRAIHFGGKQQNGTDRSDEAASSVRVRDFAWCQAPTASRDSPRLVAVTSDSQTILFDPSNREQLSGNCPSAPVAALTGGSPGSSDCRIVLDNGIVETLRRAPDSAAGISPASFFQPQRRSGDLPPPNKSGTAKLPFQPDFGPWQSWPFADPDRTLARGWLAKNEPALFMLDVQLNPLWHYPMPLQPAPPNIAPAVARDPRTGHSIWAVASMGGRIHLLSDDGRRTDHFAVEADIVGLTLVADGNQLLMNVVHPQSVVHYQVR